jgi:hypothetical protein
MRKVMETKLRALVFTVAFALSPVGSFANDHQICYQVPPRPGTTTITADFLCRTDGTSTPGCQVTAVTGAATFFHLPQGASDAGEATFTAPGTYVGTIQFNDGVSRTCTVEIPANANLKPTFGEQNPGVLAYTTDASGLATTGIWTAHSFASPDLRQVTLTPPDFVAVGGGFAGATSGPATFMALDEASSPEEWSSIGSTSPPGASGVVTGYSIGLKIEGLTLAQLQGLYKFTGSGFSPSSSRPSMTQTVSVSYPQTTAAIGGGGQTAPPGQYINVTAPQTWQQCFANSTCEEILSGWKVSSLNTGPLFIHRGGSSKPGVVITELVTLPKVLTIAGQTYHIETWILSANSSSGQQASATVTLPIDYALTSIGATATTSGFVTAGGNVIWSLVPVQGGATAGSVALATARAGVITVSAVGMKLVLGPIPALQPKNLNKLPGVGKTPIKPPIKAP